MISSSVQILENSTGEDSYSSLGSRDLDRTLIARILWARIFGSADKSGQNEDSVSDVQYILQTLTGIEDRLAKVEDSNSRQGKEI